ncbi:MAG: DUF3387 domain-containing protein [Lentisphaeraceae bacterium]|nr:DUF3387 domain-containing protein [Lentisphaeraceae bacterium]
MGDAGEKVKALIDEHLIGLGINLKVPPVELFSPMFVKQLDKNKTSKAKASEMEHALRKHSKVNFDEDPAFYTRMSEKLDKLIQKHKNQWDLLLKGMEEIMAEAQQGRKDNEISGINKTEAPFYDLVQSLAYEGQGISKEIQETLKSFTVELIKHFQKTIDIINFWKNDNEVDTLSGEVSDLLFYTKLDKLIEHEEVLVKELISLACRRHKDLLN